MQKGVEKLSFREKFLFGIGEIPSTVSDVFISMYFLYHMTGIIGISIPIAGNILMVGRIWVFLISPIMGFITDRTDTRWGRRRTYFLFMAVPLGIFFTLISTPYPMINPTAKIVILFISYILFITCITAFRVPYLAYMTEMTEDYSDRTSINVYRAFFSILVGLAAFILPIIAGLIIAVVLTAICLIVYKTSSERYMHIKPNKRLNVFAQLGETFRNSSFNSLLVILLGIGGGVAFLMGFLTYYIYYYVAQESILSLAFGSLSIAGLILLSLWTVITRRFGKKLALIIPLCVWLIAQIGWVILGPQTPSYMIFTLCALAGIGIGASLVIPWAMLPDTVDQDEISSGERRGGIYSGLMAMVLAIGGGLSMFIIKFILQAIGYVPGIEQSETTMEAIRLIMCLGPMVFIIIALVGAILYPITRERYAEIRAELERLRKERVA